MKTRLETIYRGTLVFLVITFLWGLWASAQQITNQLETTDSTNSTFLPKRLSSEDHYLTFGLDRIGLLSHHKLLGEPLWKYVASLIYILLAFYVSKLIDLITRFWLKRLAAKSQTQLDDLLRGPVKVVAFVLLVNIGLNIFDWSDKAKLYLLRALILIVAGSLTYLAIKILNLLLEAWRHRLAAEDRKLNEQLFSFLRKSVNAFVIIVAVMVTAQNMGINMTAAITSLSIGGLAVGLAAQDR